MSGADGEKAAIRRIGVHEFRGNMAAVLRQSRSGSSFLVMSRNEGLAEIHPPSKAARPRRQPGAMRGQIHTAPDFDELPADILAAMEGDQA